MSDFSLQVKNLDFSYQSSPPVLRNVSFTLKQGEVLGILGGNGSGKSTLLHILAGILDADAGSAIWNEKTISSNHLNELRSKIGLVFQEANNQLFMPIVRDDVAFGPINLGLKPDEVSARVDQVFHELQIAHLSDKLTHRLSGGEKRMVSIATILTMKPELLLLDEPSANLDPHARRQLIKLLSSRPETKIIATHDLDMAYELCTRCIVLHQGRILADGTPKEIFANESLLDEAKLEQPYLFLLNQLKESRMA